MVRDFCWSLKLIFQPPVHKAHDGGGEDHPNELIPVEKGQSEELGSIPSIDPWEAKCDVRDGKEQPGAGATAFGRWH